EPSPMIKGTSVRSPWSWATPSPTWAASTSSESAMRDCAAWSIMSFESFIRVKRHRLFCRARKLLNLVPTAMRFLWIIDRLVFGRRPFGHTPLTADLLAEQLLLMKEIQDRVHRHVPTLRQCFWSMPVSHYFAPSNFQAGPGS